jgi:hypothetical protein
MASTLLILSSGFTTLWNTTPIPRDDTPLLSPVLINDLSMLLVH